MHGFLNLGDDATEIDAMEWMHTHHMASKDLTAGEKLAMTDKLKAAIKEDNERRKLEGTYNSHESRKDKNGSLQMEGCKNNIDRSTWTDNQIAKKAGVGTGTVARYNKVRLAVVDKFKRKIQERAKENQSLGGGDQKSKNRVSPNGEKRNYNIAPTHTDKELAKMAGVGTGGTKLTANLPQAKMDLRKIYHKSTAYTQNGGS